MPAKVILNPYSNRWKARKRWPEAVTALNAAGVDYSVAVSEHRGHDRELSRQAALDGELFPQEIDQLEYGILPRRLNVLTT